MLTGGACRGSSAGESSQQGASTEEEGARILHSQPLRVSTARIGRLNSPAHFPSYFVNISPEPCSPCLNSPKSQGDCDHIKEKEARMSPDAALPPPFCAFLRLDYPFILCAPAAASPLCRKKSKPCKKFIAKNLLLPHPALTPFLFPGGSYRYHFLCSVCQCKKCPNL